MYDDNLCTNPNHPSFEEKTIWIAELSNGLRIYQDDDREGRPIPSWSLLRGYLKSSGLSISRFWLKFRSHMEEITPPPDYFCKGIMAHGIVGASLNEKHFVLVGHSSDDKKNLKYQKFMIPEIIPFESGIRDLKENEEALL